MVQVSVYSADGVHNSSLLKKRTYSGFENNFIQLFEEFHFVKHLLFLF